MNRLDQGLDAQAGTEVERLRSQPGNRLEIAADLDRLEFIETSW